MIQIEAKDLTCWSDSCRTVGYGDVVLLSMFGNRNAVRAAWAVFFERQKYPCVRLGEDSLHRIDGVPYSTIQKPIDRGLLHTIILHPSATNHGSPFDESFFQIGPNAEERFFPRFTRRCPVPVRQEWKRTIWDIGLREKEIFSLKGHGIRAFRVNTSKDVWEPIIRNAIVSGEIS